jgi:hypothetical protein
MLTTKQLKEINDWRRNWATTGSRKLSIVGCDTEEEVISKAIDKAHAPSVLRALKTGGISTKAPRAEVKELLINELSKALYASMSQKEFDNWNAHLCEKIKGIYHKYKITDYTLGNAQKLLNMAIKYTLSANIIDPDLDFFKIANIPVDRIIMKAATKKLGVAPLEKAWSATDDMTELLDYQSRLRDSLSSDEFPLLWEIKNW